MIILSIFDNFEMSNLFYFLLGIVTGFILLIIILVLLITKTKNEETKIYRPTIKDFNDEEINNLITKKQQDFLYEIEENDREYLKTFFNISLSLLHEIASYYYPDSANPEYELTVTEASNLIHYIVDKIMSVLDKPVIKRLKNARISTIKLSIEKTKKITNSKALKTIKKSGVDEAVTTGRTFLNMFNPVFWAKKLLVDGMANITIKKVLKAGISIIGEESNKVYSKNLFDDKNISDKTKNDIEEIYNDEA